MAGAHRNGSTPQPPAGDPDGETHPTIVISGRRLHVITGDAILALQHANGDAPFLFARGGALVRLGPGDGRPVAEPVTPPALKGELDRRAVFVRGDGSLARPPGDVVADILALPALPFPRLEGIVSAPTFLADGTLLAREGYHAPSGLYLHQDALTTVRADLSAAEALAVLDDAIGEFPFGDDSSYAHALALLLQPFVRPLIAGPTPLYLLDAPTRGTGKGLLAEVAALIALGHGAHVMAVPADADELEKRITAALIEGASTIHLDNVTRLSQAPLAAALTAETWAGRLLGQSKMLHLPQRATWIATGNNVALSDEMVRRTVLIRLDAGVERPEERSDFRHADLLGWVRAQRGALVSACLSLVARWLEAVKPAGEAGAVLGRFESWTSVMAGILGVSGVSGFLAGRERLCSQADSESEEWRAFCAAWWERHAEQPVSSGELLALAKETTLLAALWAGRSDLAGAQRLGHALGGKRDRVFGQFTIRIAGRSAATRNASYRLERRGPAENTRNTRNTRPPGESESETASVGPGVFDGLVPETPGNTHPSGQNTRSVLNLNTGVSGVSGVFPPPSADGTDVEPSTVLEPSGDGPRRVYGAAAAATWRAARIGPGLVVGGDEDLWRRFCFHPRTREDHLQAAWRALQPAVGGPGGGGP